MNVQLQVSVDTNNVDTNTNNESVDYESVSEQTIDWSFLSRPNREREWNDHIDDTAVIEDDGRSENRTMFYPTENMKNVSQSRQKQIKRMHRINSGVRVNDGNRSDRTRRANRMMLVQIIADQMDMTPHQESRVKAIIEGLKLYSFGPYSSEKIILSAVTYVCRLDRRMIEDEPLFHEFVDSFNTTQNELKRIRRMFSNEDKWEDEKLI